MSSAIQISEFSMEACRELIGNALLGLAIVQDKKLVYANKGLADIIGIDLEDMLALSSEDFMSMIYSADRNRILGSLIDGISSNRLPLRQEFRITRKNGDIIWTDARANFIEFNGKRAMQVAFMDITSRKNEEIETNAAKEEFAEILSSISDSFLALDDNMLITYINKAAELMLGGVASEILGCNLFDAFPEFRGSIFEDTCNRAVKEKRSISFETYFGKNPHKNWYDVRIYPRKNGISVYSQVITERKKVEDQLLTALQRFYSILSNMYASILLVSNEGRVEFANQAFCEFFNLDDAPRELNGITAPEMIEKIKNEYLHPDEDVARIKEIIERGEPVKGEEIAMKNGRTCLRDFIPIKINGKSYGRLWHHHDITVRKRAEEALSKNMALLSMSQEIGHLGNWSLDFDSGRFEASDEDYRIYGLVPQSSTALDDIWDLIHPDDMERYREYVESVQREGRLGGLDYRILLPDGSMRYVHALTSNVVYDQNGNVKIASGITQDITERKQVEEALRKSEQKFRSIVESSEAGIILIDDDGNIAEWNASQEYITGLKREAVLGRPAWDIKFQLIPEEQKTQEAFDKLKSFLLRLTDKGRVALKGWLNDQEIQGADGKRKTIHEVIFPIKTDKGYSIGVIAHDVTERMEKERSLRIKNEAIESALNAMSLASPLGDLFYANESWLRMMGYEKKEVEGRSLLDFLQDPKDADEIVGQISATGRWEGELVARKKDGSTFDAYFCANMIENAVGKPLCLHGSILDITNRKKMEKELREREERFRKIFELSPIGIQLYDAEGFLISANQASKKIMSTIEASGHKRCNIFRDLLSDVEDQHRLMSGQIVNEGNWIKAKTDKAAKNDRDISQDRKGKVYIENTMTSLGGDGGEPEGYLCLQQDLTEHRLADELMISENERLQIIYDIWKTRVKTSNMRIED